MSRSDFNRGANQFVNIAAMTGSLFLGPVGILGVFFFGFRAQKLAMEEKAEKVADHLDESDDTILDAVDRHRPAVRGARVTHTFPVENNALFGIYHTGISETTWDRSTGRRTKRVSAGIGWPNPPEEGGDDE